VFGSTHPFTTSTLSDSSGRFIVKNLTPGTYTISVFVPGSGEARQTVEVGAGTADNRGRVRVALRLTADEMERDSLQRRHAVSTKQLAIPEVARREYAAAQRELEEEAGAQLKVRNVKFLGVVNFTDFQPKHYVDISFVAEWEAGEPLNKAPEETTKWQWFPLDELPQPLFPPVEKYLLAIKTKQTFFDSKF